MDRTVEIEIINMYTVLNMSCSKIAKKLNLNPTTVFNALKRNNIETRTKGGIYKLNQDKIFQLYYTDSMTLEEIALKLNVSLETIRQVLIRGGLYIKKKGNAYTNSNLIDDIFESIDCEIKAYLLGFLITDGNIDSTAGRSTVRLSIQNQDSYILEKFKELVKSDSSIIKDTRGCSTFNIESKKMMADLEKLGVIPNKTWHTYLPKINDDMMPHLIRGLIDGDGWITKYKRKDKNFFSYGIGLCGNYDLVSETKNYLVANLKVYDVKITMRDSLASVVWGNKNDIINISKYIYRDSTICLTRKYDKISDLL